LRGGVIQVCPHHFLEEMSMYRRLSAIGVLGCLAAMAVPASAQYQYFENFETSLAGWSSWTQRGTAGSTLTGESPTLGNIPPYSDINDAMAYVGGPGSGANFNGGIYKTITLPLGPGTYKIDGFVRSKDAAINTMWTELQMWEGTFVLNNANDYDPPNQGHQNGSIADGELLYKTDSFTAPYNNSSGWSGQISSVDNNGATPAGVRSFTTTTGTITLLLKTGNVGGLGSSYWDDINITPEPSTLLLLTLPSIALMRGRRRVA
jgi:hypothetical protein